MNALVKERAAGPLVRERRRAAGLALLLGLALAAIAGRTAYWQIALGGPLAARADAEHLVARRIPAGRGGILDAHGRWLALNLTEDTVIVDPDLLREEGTAATVAARLAGLLGLPVERVRARVSVAGAYARLDGADGQPLWLDDTASRRVAAAIAAGELDGVRLYPAVRRIYPAGALASQVLGFVRMSDGMGQYGIEAQANALLAGQPGWLSSAVDAAGNPLATGPQRWTPPRPGADVTLTLDAMVQDMAERGLADAIARTGADGGTVLVLDPHTGAVLALANLPAFDPNAYAAAPLSAFDDPAVSAQYDPGSVMKAITMATALDVGAITPETAFDDAGAVTVAGVTLHNWNDIAWGTETMTQVLAHSANVGAVWAAQRVGEQRFADYQARFGFGAPTGVDLPSEAAGQVPHPADPGAAELTMAEQSFGESIAVTPLQLAAAYGALANGGVLMRPYMIACVAGDGGQGRRTCATPHAVRQVVSPATARTVTQMLTDSARVSEARMDLLPGYSAAVKTGTATPDPAHPARTYATMVGYAPASDPRFVLLVKLDHPQTNIFGGGAAGPLWRALAEQLFVYEGISPDLPVGAP
jgi:cell division protein FtsI/penicillin-binding protein 2